LICQHSRNPTASDKDDFCKKFQIDRNDQMTIALSVAKMSPQKNLKRLLRAFAKASLHIPQLYLWMVGSGEQEKELHLLSIQLGVEKRIQFFSSIPQNELRCAYNLSDFLVFPSIFEGLPRAVVEALYYGLPVIGANIPGVLELVQNGFNGLLVDPKQIDDIAFSMVRLAIDKQLRMQLSRNAPCIVRKRFMGDAIWGLEAKLYQSVIEGHKIDVNKDSYK